LARLVGERGVFVERPGGNEQGGCDAEALELLALGVALVELEGLDEPERGQGALAGVPIPEWPRST